MSGISDARSIAALRQPGAGPSTDGAPALESLTAHLKPVHNRSNPLVYLREVIARRAFIVADARARLISDNARTMLGNRWLIVRPIMDLAFFYVVFGLLLGGSRQGGAVRGGVQNFVAFLAIGILMSAYITGAFTGGSQVMKNGRGLIRAFTFPSAVLPISRWLRETMQMGVVVAVLLVMVIAIPPHAMPAVTWLLVPLVFVLQAVLVLGLYFLVARLSSIWPDLYQVTGFVGRLIMYGSGVLFPIDHLVKDPGLKAVLVVNPVFIVLDMYRAVIIDHRPPPAVQWELLSGWAVGVLIVGYLFFWSGENEYTRERY